MRLIDVDELWKDITSEIDACSDVLDIIERQTLIDTSKELVICPVKVNMDMDEIIERLKEQGWRPMKHGRWIMHPNGHGTCSNCKKCSLDIMGGVDSNFCPNCGAMMDGDEE